MSETRARLERLKLVGGAHALDFANTGGLINDYGDLLTWAERAGVVEEADAERLRARADEQPDEASVALGRALALRRAIRRIFSARARGEDAEKRDLAHLSSVIGRSARHLALRPSGNGYAWAWRDAGDRLDWLGWIVARSAADLLTGDQRDRVKECKGRGCDWLFVDTSRNRSRRWCDMAECGNRAKARRSYARRQRANRPSG